MKPWDILLFKEKKLVDYPKSDAWTPQHVFLIKLFTKLF